MAEYFQENGKDLVICGDIGDEAFRTIAVRHITVIGFSKGNADEIVNIYPDWSLIKKRTRLFRVR